MQNRLDELYGKIDENAIWENISNELDKASDSSSPDLSCFDEAPMHKRINIRPAAIAAAAAAVVIVSLSTVNRSADMSESNSLDNNAPAEDSFSAESNDECSADGMIYFPASDGWEYRSAVVSPGTAQSSGISVAEERESYYFEDNYSDEFFTEANVLEKTDFFIDCIVESISYDPEEASVTYTVTPLNCVADKELYLPEQMKIVSGTAYIMQQGREYLIPVTVSDGEYEPADKSFPQIELTEEGLILFHNGWQSLMDGEQEMYSAQQISPDDFFYDRMNINRESTLQNLFDKAFS